VGEVGVLDELIVLIRFARALRMIEEEREKRVFKRFKIAERILKAVLVAAAVSYVISYILGDYWSALSAVVLGLVAGIALVDVRLRRVEASTADLRAKLRALQKCIEEHGG
jgi:F0F1-type ATP synthase assembly protein I